jgi:hypothetical protein
MTSQLPGLHDASYLTVLHISSFPCPLWHFTILYPLCVGLRTLPTLAC